MLLALPAIRSTQLWSEKAMLMHLLWRRKCFFFYFFNEKSLNCVNIFACLSYIVLCFYSTFAVKFSYNDLFFSVLFCDTKYIYIRIPVHMYMHLGKEYSVRIVIHPSIFSFVCPFATYFHVFMSLMSEFLKETQVAPYSTKVRYLEI